MPDNGDGAPGAPSDSQIVEQKMRRALGLGGNNGGGSRQNTPRVPQQRADVARQRHRFVQDGGVPVVLVNHRPEDGNALKERITELERQLALERTAHAEARRALGEAQAQARETETRLVHAGLAHQEALNAERRALASAQRALNDALTKLQTPARRARVEEPAAAPPAEAVAQASEPSRPVEAQAETAIKAEPKKRGRPRTRPLPEPKPVRWWTPSFRAKTKA